MWSIYELIPKESENVFDGRRVVTRETEEEIYYILRALEQTNRLFDTYIIKKEEK